MDPMIEKMTHPELYGLLMGEPELVRRVERCKFG